MTELLPIVFQKGVNESIDSRVAPPEVHSVAQNVRWRKDGRPAKRYGSAAISTAGFEQAGSQYLTQPANAITSWNGQPLLAVGSGVASLAGSNWGLRAPANMTAIDLSHWGPGERNTVVSPERYQLQKATIASGGGVVLFIWEDGSTIYYSARSRDGAVLIQPTLFGGTVVAPRLVPSTANSGRYIYMLTKQGGTSLVINVFDTTLVAFTGASVTVDTLGSSAFYFDAASRGSDFVVCYQKSAVQGVVKLYAAAATPTLSQTQTFVMSSSVAAKMGVAGTSTSDVFAGYVQDSASGGRIAYVEFNNAVTAALAGPTVIDTDVNSADQPTFSIDANQSALMIWGGELTPLGYTKLAVVTSAGLSGAVLTRYGVRIASKAFLGPSSAALGATDKRYVWAHTHNDAGLTNYWDDQRTYYLLQLGTTIPFRRMMHTPNMVASLSSCRDHLADVYDEGTGYGFSTALINTTRSASGTQESFSLEWITFRSIFESQRIATRDYASAGRAVQFSGGALMEYTGSVEETGFTNFPVITGLVSAVGGSMTPSSTYLYRVVYEYIDAQGRRHRSTPSDPRTVTMGVADTQVTVSFLTMVADSRLPVSTLQTSSVVAHVYRTLAGGGTYHRVTPNYGAPVGTNPAVGSGTFLDTMADSAAALTEFIYTDGGVVPNTLPPPCTFMTVCGGRVWLAGQLDRCVITASKLLVDGEPTQFSDELEFSVFLPDKCTGIASIDGTVVAFARERIFFITGDGPNDQGIGSFNPPTELPTDVGCIDWRSVVETSLGVFFQGKRGIYLLPRGFNTPVFVGAEVESTLASFPIIASATLVVQPSTSASFLGEVTVRFVAAQDETATTARVLTYDIRTGGWSVDVDTGGGNPRGVAGTWSDTFIFSSVGLLRSETVGSYSDNGVAVVSRLATGDIRPFGVAGYGGFDRVVIMGEFRAACTVVISISVDGANADVFAFALTSGDDPNGTVYLECSPSVRMGTSIAVTVADGSSSPTEGFITQAVFIEHETIGKTKRLPATRKA